MYVTCLYQCISTCVLCVVNVCNPRAVRMFSACAHTCASSRVYVQRMRVSALTSTFIVQINSDVFCMSSEKVVL